MFFVTNSDELCFKIFMSLQYQVAGDKLTALRKVLDASERKIISLTKSLQTSCKMKGEPSCGEAILLVTNHLKKKACCRFTRLDLQVPIFVCLLLQYTIRLLYGAETCLISHTVSCGKLMI